MKAAALGVMFALAAGPVAAADMPATPNDFAYGVGLTVDGDHGLYQLNLPAVVYAEVTRADRGDMRVFNGAGEVVPHSLRGAPPESAAETAAVPLPLFPVYGRADERPELVSMRVARNVDGRIVEVIRHGQAPRREQRVIAYLVDASKLDGAIEALDLDWDAATTGFVGEIALATSDDLERWTTRVEHAAIASLAYAGHALERRRIEFKPVKAKYLRLSWSMREPFTLSAVRARPVAAAVEAEREWLAPASAPADQPGAYRLGFASHAPVDRMRIRFAQHNSLTQVELYSRPTEKQPWQLHGRGLLYDLEIEGKRLTDTTLVFPATAAREWLLKTDQANGGLGPAAPQIEFGWVPQQLVFVARGDGPFTLAYGSARVAPTPAADPLAQLVRENRDRASARVARAGEPRTLGGAALLAPPTAIAWKKWILWAAIAGGVLLLAWMARRLWHELNAKPRP